MNDRVRQEQERDMARMRADAEIAIQRAHARGAISRQEAEVICWLAGINLEINKEVSHG